MYKNGKKKYVSLGISVLPQYWDSDKNKPKRHCPNKDMIEKVIAEKSRQHSERVIELISEHREFTATRLVEQIDSYSPCRMVGDMFLLQIQRLKNNIVKVTPYLIRKSIIHCYHSLLKFNGHLNLFLRY